MLAFDLFQYFWLYSLFFSSSFLYSFCITACRSLFSSLHLFCSLLVLTFVPLDKKVDKVVFFCFHLNEGLLFAKRFWQFFHTLGSIHCCAETFFFFSVSEKRKIWKKKVRKKKHRWPYRKVFYYANFLFGFMFLWIVVDSFLFFSWFLIFSSCIL